MQISTSFFNLPRGPGGSPAAAGEREEMAVKLTHYLNLVEEARDGEGEAATLGGAQGSGSVARRRNDDEDEPLGCAVERHV